MADNLNEVQVPTRKFYARKDRTPDMALGVKTVEFLNLAHARGGPPVAVYRPLDRTMPVYQAGKRWDYKPFDEFLDLYVPIWDEAWVTQLEALRRELYGD